MDVLDNELNRQKIIDDLHRELVGPDPTGEEIDCAGEIGFSAENWTSIFGPWHQKRSDALPEQPAQGDEILCLEPPTRRYGIGVLYPVNANGASSSTDNAITTAAEGISSDADDDATAVLPEAVVGKSASEDLETIESRAPRAQEFSGQEDLGLSQANVRNPSVIGLSFLAEIPDDSRLDIEAKFGLYENKTVAANNIKPDGSEGTFERDWWIRKQNVWRESFTSKELLSESRLTRSRVTVCGTNKLKICFDVISRPTDDANVRLLTISLINRTEEISSLNSACLFQCEMRAGVNAKSGSNYILPYPRNSKRLTIDESSADEEDSFELLYSRTHAYAVGHGCCGNWVNGEGTERASAVFADVLPKIDVPNITPEIFRKTSDGISKPVQVSMRSLAGLESADDGLVSIAEILDLYQEWIDAQELTALDVKYERHRAAAARHITLCRGALARMRRGLLILKSDDAKDAQLKRAFKLANRAMLQQQVRSDSKPRPIRWNGDDFKIIFEGKAAERDALAEPSEKGNWRPFQIAFLLLALESTARGDCLERRTVELIWFPTGGGKTEAYLGLAAFSIFLRRLAKPGDVGTQVLMRYTLRLLTAQQFQRAAALVCAMEELRQKNTSELGSHPIRIGVWLGRDTTPNTRQDAKSQLKKLRKTLTERDNSFVLLRCPWCNAPMGLSGLKSERARAHNAPPGVIGYREANGTVVYHCADPKCHFSNSLPVVTIDEDIYTDPPEIVIGTVDKFAQLTWDPRARSLFGISDEGIRTAAPPGLIIQDELHLISGPLGSMVGIYELVIEELCTDRREVDPIPPKIVTSTATIRRYGDQIRALFARTDARLFPPPGLNASDNFFSRPAVNAHGVPSSKIFVGVHGTTLGSLQTAQVRVMSTLLQSPMGLKSDERDPWWTTLIFFNSLRELGTTVSLFQSDIPYRLIILMRRYGLNPQQLRRLSRIEELTSRLNNSEIPKAIDELSSVYSERSAAVDACLASSIIEVGVDIDRLSLMVVVGQPKTTAQYIQVAGRVGRRWWERPGLVVTLLSPSKPRDRSHYEKFRISHDRLYSEVEPTSVTPFSAPAVERALHAVLAAFVRQMGTENVGKSPMPFPTELVDKFAASLRQRVKIVDEDNWDYVQGALSRRITEWKNWHRDYWDFRGGHREVAQLRMAGSYASKIVRERSWATQNSMRNVDAECRMMVTQLYVPPAEQM